MRPAGSSAPIKPERNCEGVDLRWIIEGWKESIEHFVQGEGWAPPRLRPATGGYLNMSKRQAMAAFQEYLDERGPALERLRGALTADGYDPDSLLDGTVESLIPLWRWIVSHLARRDALGATDPASVPRKEWPSWERHTREEETTLSFESLVLLDGLVSYLGVVIQTHAPTARWEIARHRIRRYVVNQHPVLVSGGGENHCFLPGVPQSHACGLLRGMSEVPDDTIANYARGTIDYLNAEGRTDEDPAADEPLAEVEDLGGDGLRGRELEVSLREDIAHEHSRVVDRLVRALAQQDGITKVLREDREVLLVATPGWTTGQLEDWVLHYLEAHVRD